MPVTSATALDLAIPARVTASVAALIDSATGRFPTKNLDDVSLAAETLSAMFLDRAMEALVTASVAAETLSAGLLDPTKTLVGASDALVDSVGFLDPTKTLVGASDVVLTDSLGFRDREKSLVTASVEEPLSATDLAMEEERVTASVAAETDSLTERM